MSFYTLMDSQTDRETEIFTEFITLLLVTPASEYGKNEAPPPPVCHRPASEWFPSRGSCSSFLLPQLLRQVVFGRPRFRFPSGVQWIATLVTELASLRSTIQRHRFPVMMVSICSCWHRAERSQLEMDLGQKMLRILLRLVTYSEPYRRVNDMQLW